MKIKKIIVKKLFGTKDFSLVLNNGRGFFFGENGAGKTTFLNTVYAILSGQENLIPQELKYDEFIIEFDNGKKLKSHRSNMWIKEEDSSEGNLQYYYNQLTTYLNNYRTYLESIKINYPTLAGFDLEDKIQSIESKDVDLLINNSSLSKEFVNINQSIASDLGNQNPHSWYQTVLSSYQQIRTRLQQNNLKEAKELLNNINHDILYLNVYRNRPKINISKTHSRSENELYEDGAIVLTSQKLDELKKKVQDSANQMKTLINQYYRDMSNSLLDKLLSDNETSNTHSIEEDDSGYIDSIFTFLHGINPEKKERLKEILLSSNSDETSVILKKSFIPFIREYKNKALPIEKQIDEFLSVVNRYLVHKKIEFNKEEFHFTLKIGSKVVTLDEKFLSSGEKHIFSVFANLVFNKKQNIHLLIDEPELSLSINWQKMFIEDIAQFDKVKNLIFVTHSPYVISEEMIDDLQKFPSGNENG